MENPQGKYPAEGIGHFRQYLNHIKSKARELPDEPAVWTSVDIVANELNHSINQRKVTLEEAESFRQDMAAFMSVKPNRDNYISCLGKEATFWWEIGKQEAPDNHP